MRLTPENLEQYKLYKKKKITCKIKTEITGGIYCSHSGRNRFKMKIGGALDLNFFKMVTLLTGVFISVISFFTPAIGLRISFRVCFKKNISFIVLDSIPFHVADAKKNKKPMFYNPFVVLIFGKTHIHYSCRKESRNVNAGDHDKCNCQCQAHWTVAHGKRLITIETKGGIMERRIRKSFSSSRASKLLNR